MIQRIQSIYLVLAGLFPAFTFFVPVWAFYGAKESFNISSVGYYPACLPEIVGRHPYGMAFFAIASIIADVTAIFTYKNRKKQIKITNLAMASNLMWYISFAAYILSVQSRTATSLHFELGCLFPVLAIIVLYLAKRAIKHDEALIRAADRIR